MKLTLNDSSPTIVTSLIDVMKLYQPFYMEVMVSCDEINDYLHCHWHGEHISM